MLSFVFVYQLPTQSADWWKYDVKDHSQGVIKCCLCVYVFSKATLKLRGCCDFVFYFLSEVSDDNASLLSSPLFSLQSHSSHPFSSLHSSLPPSPPYSNYPMIKGVIARLKRISKLGLITFFSTNRFSFSPRFFFSITPDQVLLSFWRYPTQLVWVHPCCSFLNLASSEKDSPVCLSLHMHA